MAPQTLPKIEGHLLALFRRLGVFGFHADEHAHHGDLAQDLAHDLEKMAG